MAIEGDGISGNTQGFKVVFMQPEVISIHVRILEKRDRLTALQLRESRFLSMADIEEGHHKYYLKKKKRETVRERERKKKALCHEGNDGVNLSKKTKCESKTNMERESSRQREERFWVQKSLLRAAVLSAQTVKRAGPPAVTGVLVIDTAEFYSLSHAAEAERSDRENPHKGTFLPFICHVLNI